MAATHARLLHPELRTGEDAIVLPPALRQIADRIEASREFVRTDTNRDDDTGYDEETWRRAARLVGDASTSYWRTRRRVPPTPVIADGPDGVVDILWKHGGRQLLLTVHPVPDDVATFYGRNLESNRDILKGDLVLDRDNEWLLAWLTA